ncbi:MAG TPA: carboxypeptidase-like regulatory domain-containing protein [Pyrinomonadaceae bacterium]|nr:carboxypeptidase-like regulatory domain-containing protein [Pyrinomonadaceae bacterium]
MESIINGNGHLWNIEIQSRNLPSDRKVTITAENKVDFLRGRKEVTLGKEANKSVTIVMTRDRSARAFGSVVDEGQKPIADALVYVIGYENEATHTGDKGQFDLPAHAANGEPIRVRVEKKGYGPEEAVNFSGNESIPIVLSRSRR